MPGQRERVEIEILRRRTLAAAGDLTTINAAISALQTSVTNINSTLAVIQAQIAVLETRDVVLVEAGDSPHALADGVVLVLVDASAGDVTVTLPAAASHSGRAVSVKRVDDASANTVTIDPNSSETADDGTTVTIGNEYESVTLLSDGTEWWIE